MTYAIPKQSGQRKKNDEEKSLQTLNRNRDKILSELV